VLTAERPPALDPTIARLPISPAAIHFVGIGGIGMSGLARILHAWGYRVSGSDAVASDQTEALAALGIPVEIGHRDLARAATAALVVVTAAVRGDNPEVTAAQAAGVPVVKRAELLGLLANARRCVAVAGSHGKSTTSGMLVVALRRLGADPSYAVGATVGATGLNAAPGGGTEMIVEADEYDYSFLWLRPDVAIVTNVDYDHHDLFPDQESYDAAFARFVAGIRSSGTLVLPADDAGCARLRERIADCPAHIVTFGQTEEADWRLAGKAGDWSVQAPDGPTCVLPLAVPGEHNARNATAALAALVALGHEAGAAAVALGDFGGVGRRFELKGESSGIVVVDDYAHHPSEVRATIRAARARYPERRLWAVFQPHTYSRTKALLPDFAAALREADRRAILEIYPARETDTLGVSSADLCALLPPDTLNGANPTDAAHHLAAAVAPGDLVLTLGAGDVTDLGPVLLDLLRGRDDAPLRTTERRRVRGSDETVPGYPSLRIFRDEPMSRHTTWRIGGPADVLVRAPNLDALLTALAWGREQGLPLTVIGGGSNLLVGDRGIRGLVILCRTPGERADGLVEADDRGDHVILRVGAQAPLSWVGRYAAERGWAGLDWGVGLPGTIGGATVNNAGAHGTELKDHLDAVVVCDNIGETATFPGDWLDASYRLTRLKAAPRPRPLTVLAATFRLPKGDTAELVRLADEHAAFRKQTQPTGACAGSTFANPEGDFAGRLLEAAGLKGHRVGGVHFSPKHANWIVNTGGANAADVRELIAHARSVTHDRFDIDLRPEVEEIGEF
jgi:UDP-N-acetylmuramate--alanine ligase